MFARACVYYACVCDRLLLMCLSVVSGIDLVVLYVVLLCVCVRVCVLA